MGFDATLELAPRPSTRALMLLFWAHLLIAAGAVFAMEPGLLMLGLAAGLALSWLRLRRHPALGFGPRGLRRLIWHADGRWTLQEAGGRSCTAKLLDSSYHHPRLIILNFADDEDRRSTRILLGDELDAEPLRRLHARLSYARETRT